jgi:transcriptional antiterminator NusG
MDDEKRELAVPETMSEGLEAAAAEDGEEKSADVEASAAESTEDTATPEAIEVAAPEAVEAVEAVEAESAQTSKKTKASTAKKAGGKKTSVKGKKTAAATTKQKTGTAIVEVEGEASESKLPMKWYVIHTYSGHENKVKENIQKMVKTSSVKDQFGRLIVPTEEVAEMRKGKKTITTRKFFPSYILIEMFMSEDSWHLVNGIPGVTSFVGTGTKPQPLAESEVERVLGRINKERDTISPEIPFTLGEHIRIKDGPFSDFTGVIDEINTEKGKLRVLVSIFGRETPVELDFLQVEPI